MHRLKATIEQSDTLSGKWFDVFIQLLIVASLISFSISTFPNLSASAIEYLRYFEITTVVIFTGEYLARLFVADKKWKFVFSFFGLIDLLAIVPFYIAVGLDLRTLRAFRLLRLIRVFKLARYSGAAKRLHNAFIVIKEELILFLFAAVIVLYLAGVGIYYFENPVQPEAFASIFHSLWWAVTTLTTVGYGDMYPITVGGKIFTFFILCIGLGVVSIPAGLVASALAKAREMEYKPSPKKNQDIN